MQPLLTLQLRLLLRLGEELPKRKALVWVRESCSLNGMHRFCHYRGDEPMLMVKLVSLAVALLVVAVVTTRNIKRNFQPPLRSHLELFLAGAPIGFVGMLIVLSDRADTMWLAVASGVLSGIGYSFSLPRQWRYDRRTTKVKNAPPERRRREEQE